MIPVASLAIASERPFYWPTHCCLWGAEEVNNIAQLEPVMPAETEQFVSASKLDPLCMPKEGMLTQEAVLFASAPH